MSIEFSQSAKLYQERRLPADQETNRQPGPRLDLAHNQANFLTLWPPSPLPTVTQAENPQDPDAGLTGVWPFGDNFP